MFLFLDSRVLGPKCLLACLHSKRPVPELPSPLYNVAMDEIVITSTGFDREDKQEIQRLTERMCGIYSNNFHEGVTHLVTKVVGSKKYMVCAILCNLFLNFMIILNNTAKERFLV